MQGVSCWGLARILGDMIGGDFLSDRIHGCSRAHPMGVAPEPLGKSEICVVVQLACLCWSFALGVLTRALPCPVTSPLVAVKGCFDDVRILCVDSPSMPILAGLELAHRSLCGFTLAGVRSSWLVQHYPVRLTVVDEDGGM